jgi:cytochrome c biogenesis factor
VLQILQTLNQLLVLNGLALFLGGWWAFQEGTWGGWWNWDASEMLGLLIGGFGVYLLHLGITKLSLNYLRTWSLLSLFWFILTYIFIQLNFELVSHNFGSTFLLFFTKNTFFLEFISLLWMFSFLSSRWLFQLFRCMSILLLQLPQSGRTFNVFVKNMSTVYLWLLYLSLFIASLTPLINHFSWNYFKINSWNFELSIPIIILLFYMVFWVVFTPQTRVKVGQCFIVGSLIWWNPIWSILLMLKLTKWRNYYLHFVLIMLIVFNLISWQLSFIEWHLTSPLHSFNLVHTNFDFIYSSMSCNNVCLENSEIYVVQLTNTYFIWNVYYKTNALSLQSFLLVLTNSTCFNFYNLYFYWQSLFLLIEINYLNNLITIFFYTIWLYNINIYYSLWSKSLW